MSSNTAIFDFHCDLDRHDPDSMTDQITQAVSDFLLDQKWNAPNAISVVLSGDVLFIEFHNALTIEEKKLAATPNGAAMIRQIYRHHFPSPSDPVWHEIEYITGRQMRESDMDDETHTTAIAESLRTGTLMQAFHLI